MPSFIPGPYPTPRQGKEIFLFDWPFRGSRHLTRKITADLFYNVRDTMTHNLQTGIQDGRNAGKMRRTEIIVRVTEGDKGYEVLVAAEMPDAQLADSIRAAEKICRFHLTNQTPA